MELSRLLRKPRKRNAAGFFRRGAGNRTRTCMVSHWNLNPACLPIPPCPLIHFFTQELFPEVTQSESNASINSAKSAFVSPDKEVLLS